MLKEKYISEVDAIQKFRKLDTGELEVLMTKKLLTAVFLIFILAGCGRKEEGNVYTGVLEGVSIQIPALTGGKILKLFVDTGQEVRSGDTLAIVDTTELILNRDEVKASLKELNAQSGVLQTNIRKAKSDLEYVREKYQKLKELVKSQAVPQQKLDDLSNQLQRAESAYHIALQNQQMLAAKKERLTAKLKIIQKKITDAVITAPDSGIIFSKYFEEGEAVPPLSPVVELVNIKKLNVKIYISEKILPRVKYGENVRIRADGLNKEFTGKVSWVSSKAEFTPKSILTPETRTSLVYAVKISVKNPEGILKDGMPVEVILTGSSPNELIKN